MSKPKTGQAEEHPDDLAPDGSATGANCISREFTYSC
jgi:hypothetical protein